MKTILKISIATIALAALQLIALFFVLNVQKIFLLSLVCCSVLLLLIGCMLVVLVKKGFV